jgi:hypothetical protein
MTLGKQALLVSRLKIGYELERKPDKFLDVPALLNYHNACLALLLRVSQSRLGASQVLNAGLFKAVRDSQLFSADPDIGIGKLFGTPETSVSTLVF